MSFFKDVIGQEDVKQLLIHSAKNGKMPHAVLLTGPAGSGKLPIALAVARYLLCHHPAENDACGQCNSCKMMDHLAHPDMHFAFPVVRKKAGRDVVCDEFLPQWREMLGRNPYADLQEWMRVIDAGNQQPQIYVRESDEIQRKLSLKASQGGYKVMLIWLPEKMEKELSFMEEKQAAFVCCSYEFGDENARGTGRIVHVLPEMTYRKALSRTIIFTTTVLFDLTKLTKEQIYMPLVKSEDTASWWSILRQGYTVYGLDEVLAIYRRPKKSLSSNKLEALKRIWNLYRKQEHLGILPSAWYFCFWAWRATMRRI